MACLVVSSTGMRAELLAGLLAQCGPTEIADACDNAVAAIDAIDRCQPSLVILDRDGDTDDCELIARHLLKCSATARLILLSSDPRHDALRQELAAVIDPIESWQELLHCVRASCAGIASKPQPVDPFPDGACFERLTPRERSVLELIGSGLGSREIAGTLGVSLQTAETYRKSVGAKLGVSGARLVRIAVLYRCVYLGQSRFSATSRNSDGPSCLRSLQVVRDCRDGHADDRPLAHQT